MSTETIGRPRLDGRGDEGPALYDPVVVESLLQRYHCEGASYADIAAAIQRLSLQGYSVKDAAVRLNILERRAWRMMNAVVAPYPDMEAEYDHSERRARHLERIADSAMAMVVDVHEEDGYATYMALRELTQDELIDTAMTLAAMVSPDQKVDDALGWVKDGLAQVIPMRSDDE